MVSFSVPGPKRVLAVFALLALFAYVTPASPARGEPINPLRQRQLRKPASPAAGAHGAGPAEPPSETPSGEVPIKATVPIVYLGKEYEEPLPLSYAEKPIFDKGIQGARLIIKEANQAGRFVGYAFELVEAIVPANADVVAKAKEILVQGQRLHHRGSRSKGPRRRRRSA